jgi:hypothetical protein
LVETIRAEVSQKDWAKREWTNLRRVKLEALMAAMHECEDYLDRQRRSALGGEGLDEREPIVEFDTIRELYFPELVQEAYDFGHAYRVRRGLGLKLAQQVLEAGNDLDARRRAADSHRAEWDPSKLMRAAQTLRDAARKLLVEIMGVE